MVSKLFPHYDIDTIIDSLVDLYRGGQIPLLNVFHVLGLNGPKLEILHFPNRASVSNFGRFAVKIGLGETKEEAHIEALRRLIGDAR